MFVTTPRHLLTPVLLLAALLCLLGSATAAQAAEYIVTSTGDQVDESPGTGGCKTAVNSCTLRAAIEESNASSGVDDTIKFDFSFFDGQIGDTIELGTSLPTITDSVKVGGLPFLQCETDYFGLPGPCVGIDGPAGGTAFRVAAKEVVLNCLAISGAKTAVEALGAPGMRMYNDWLGLKLDGSAGPLETGVFLDQGSNVATIGGVGSETRNIFAHVGVGLDIDGADATWVRGNGFGVMPDGATPAPNGTNIEIADAATGDDRVARENWIGRALEDEELASPICDGGCNVIAGATAAGIDLAGNGTDEKPATGSTWIFGNHIGLNAFGTAGIPNAQQGVLVGSAENVTIGGPLPGDRNLINGGESGVLAGPNSGNLAIEGNWIGLGATGTSTLAPPGTAGIAIEGGYQAKISENRISMTTGTAIEATGEEAVIRSNAIGEGVGGEDLPGGSIGVHLTGNGCYQCGRVYGNSIANATHLGVLIESSRNRLYGNRIEGSGEAGVQIKEPGLLGAVTRNVVGGDTAAEENTISENGGAAIEIDHVATFGLNTRNEVARNHGKLNGGPFIDLLGGANGEIQPPVIVSSTQAGAKGTALPGATVRVFRKAGPSPGEIEEFLAEATADEAGVWEATYPTPLASGTIVAASQTRLIVGTATLGPADGTSELAFSTTTGEPQEPSSGGAGDGGGQVTSQPPARDTTPPRTTILTGAPRKSSARTAKFEFTSNEPGSRFECKFDYGPRKPCSSPMRLRRLWPGRHVFKVWAVDASGNAEESPAKTVFRVLKQPRGGA